MSINENMKTNGHHLVDVDQVLILQASCPSESEAPWLSSGCLLHHTNSLNAFLGRFRNEFGLTSYQDLKHRPSIQKRQFPESVFNIRSLHTFWSSRAGATEGNEVVGKELVPNEICCE